MSSPSKRRDTDVMKLMTSSYEVCMGDDTGKDFYVKFEGPKDSPYEGGIWKASRPPRPLRRAACRSRVARLVECCTMSGPAGSAAD
jgi:hypothetical protein